MLVAVLLAVAYWGRRSLDGGGVGGGDQMFWLLTATMATATAACAVFFAVRAAGRVAGPEHRLVAAMRRIRGGDLAFRVHLRRGDLLTPLARECNELLEWLNANPPAGVVTGGDLVAMDGFDADAGESGEAPAEDVQP